MNDSLVNRAQFNELVGRAQSAMLRADHNAAVAALSGAVTLGWINYAGVFLDRRVEQIITELAKVINVRYPMCAARTERIGFLMSSIHHAGGHSKIAWRWMQVDQQHKFNLVLTSQAGAEVPCQLNELVKSGRVTCNVLNGELTWLDAVRVARDELSDVKILIMNIHPNDVVGAIAAACLCHQTRTVFINHAFYTYSIGMSSAHALACTSPAAEAIAVSERLVSPEHIVWYRNAPEWEFEQVHSDREELIRTLGLPSDALIILSSGTEYKYYPLNGITLLDLVAPELECVANAYLVVVGIYDKEKCFPDDLLGRFAGRVITLGPIPERELLHYMAACDIYLESAPFHSGGASQQAMMLGKPVINFTDPTTYRAHLGPQFYSIDDLSWFHFTVAEYRRDLAALLGSSALRRERGRFLQREVNSRVSQLTNLESIYECYAKAESAPLISANWLDEVGHVENPEMHQAQYNLAQNFSAYVSPHARPKVVPQATPLPTKSARDVLRAIAFHLPQFHRIDENDQWWGEGFTEWDNVRQGQPLFEGHYQPRVPAELGYYDLSDVSALERQARLAREYGLEGFCFYHYWFDGKRLLEKPVNQLLAHPDIDLPFCLCWANENWTRRWDGSEHEVLLQQSYSPQLNERFALDLLPYMQDARYIRIDGKPVLLVYRCDIIPDLKLTLAAWRQAWREHGLGEVYLIAVESFKVIDPRAYGFDAASEFLPHQVNFEQLAPRTPINVAKDPQLRVAQYQQLADSWINREAPDYKRFRCVVPSWDNSSRRRKGGATVIHDASPEAYEQWLRKTVARTLVEFSGEERLVFINAWNEWGEGCYLEPDQRLGRAYLEATQRVINTDVESLQEEALSFKPLASVETWLQDRQLNEVQGALTKQYLAARSPCRLGVVILDLEGEPQCVAATLESLTAHGGEYPFESLVLSVHAQSQVAGADGFVLLNHGNWLAQLNEALKASAFDWFMCVSAGAKFTLSGLHTLKVEVCNELPCVAIYGDAVVQTEVGLGVCLRPDFNLDLLLSLPSAMARNWLYRRETFLALGGFDQSLPDAFEFDLIVRMIEQLGMNVFGHIGEPWLIIPPLVPQNVAGEVTVLQRHLLNRGYNNAQLHGDIPGHYRLIYGHVEQPLVSIIIPTKDQLPMLLRCVTSLMEKTSYPNYEVIIVDNNSETAAAVEWLSGIEAMGSERLRVLRYPHPFNYSAINNMAAQEARGEYLLLLNNDTAVLREDWLDALMNHALRPEVGIVGAKLLHPDGTIQHAGVVLGLRGPADHPFMGSGASDSGYMQRMLVDQNLSAVTAACLMIRKSLYEQVGGLDDQAFKVSYNDVDLCLKAQAAGFLTVWTPHAVLMHVGNVSQVNVDTAKQEVKRQRFVAEQDEMYRRWLPQLASDPAYNANMALHGAGYELETDSSLTWRPLTWRPLPVVLAHPADRWGSGHYRVIQPFEALRASGLIEGTLSDGLLPITDFQRYNPDVVVLQRQISNERLDVMSRIKRFTNAFTVYELDDYLPNLPIKSVHRARMPKDIIKSMRRGLSFVDRFVVSTDALADAFEGWHREIQVVENKLPVEWWGGLSSRRRRSNKPRVGWAGGISHSGDLQLIVDVVRELAGEVEWVFMGMCPEAVRPYVKEMYAGVPIDAYPQALASLDLDLALAPVESNLFNECKSNLRLLEYGACGYPVICSDNRCYQGGLPVTRVKNRFKDWVDAIRMHLNDLDASAQAGDELREVVLRDWMLEGDSLELWRKRWLPS